VTPTVVSATGLAPTAAHHWCRSQPGTATAETVGRQATADVAPKDPLEQLRRVEWSEIGLDAAEWRIMERAGDVVRITRELYQLPDAPFDAQQSLAEAPRHSNNETDS
jgi:hypothetical protein